MILAIGFGRTGGRHFAKSRFPDFVFPQFNAKEYASNDWVPTLVDCLYESATNASAFSPTDTMPLTHRAKLLKLDLFLDSIITVALVTARGVNILSRD